MASIPIIGHVTLGEEIFAHHGEVGESPPLAHYSLLGGMIKVRSAAWIPTGGRLDLAEHTLDLGDVVDTRDPAADRSMPCLARQADGFVRTKAGGALQTVLNVDQDHVILRRGRPIKIGASALEKILTQPIVALAWQCTLTVFALAGSAFTIFSFLVAYRDADKRFDA